MWLTSIALAALKHLDAIDGPDGRRRACTAWSTTRSLHGVIDHFVRLLDFTPSELQRCATDTDGHLVPRLRALNAPVAIFIDSVDEYFNKHVEDRPAQPERDRRARRRTSGTSRSSAWSRSPTSCAASTTTSRSSRRCARRRIARLPRAHRRWSQQYRGSAVDIVYSPESLREIFVNNIRLREGPTAWCCPSRAAQPIRSRPSSAAPASTDTYTREEEDAFEYICRHTLLRPRDLMTIGERLSALRPDERAQRAPAEGGGQPGRDRDRARVPGRDRALPRRPRPRPVVPAPARPRPDPRRGRGDLRRAQRRRRSRRRPARRSARSTAPACSATSQHDHVRGEWRQRFLRPGEATFEPDGVLPRSTHYLVHPVLSDVIAPHQPGLPAAHRPGQHRRLRPAVARAGRRPSARSSVRQLLRPEGRRPRLRQPDARRRRRAGAHARSRTPCGAGRRRRRSPRSAAGDCGADRRTTTRSRWRRPRAT